MTGKHPRLARALRAAATELGRPAPVEPPPELRARVLEGMRARREPAPSYAEPYAAQVAALDALLSELTEDDWRERVIYDWGVQDVLAHLIATDGLLAEALRAGEGVRPADGDVVERTTAAIGRERARSPAETAGDWRRQAAELCAALPDLASAGDRTLAVADSSMRLADQLTARAFETWIHADDIARSASRDLPVPLPPHLNAISGLGVRGLPHALAMRGHEQMATARVVLTGRGGGDWLLSLGRRPGRGPARDTGRGPGRDAGHGHGHGHGHESDLGGSAALDVTLTMDVVEFCLLAGSRLPPDLVRFAAEGDIRLARDLIDAAPEFSAQEGLSFGQ